MRSLRHGGDQGAVAVLVALLAVAMFGFAALVIDVGALYAERRQLQNGADAGALAIAQDCADTDSVCPEASTATATASIYAGENDRVDGLAAAEICGTGHPLWDSCSPAPPVPPGVAYVRVTDRTLVEVGADPDLDPEVDPNLLAPILAGVLPGDYSGTNVRAQATVAWGFGTNSTRPVLPFIMSVCEWLTLAPPDGKGFAPTPPLPLQQPVYPDGIPWSYESDIQIHGAGSCTYNPSGQTGITENLSGDFGWLAVPPGGGAKGPCVPVTETTDDGLLVEGKDGMQVCVKNWLDQHLGQIIDIPIYYEQPDNGDPYKVGGWAPFFLTGYAIPGSGTGREAATLTGRTTPTPTCLLPETPNTVQCLTGFLVDMPEGDGPITGPNFGLGTTTTRLIE